MSRLLHEWSDRTRHHSFSHLAQDNAVFYGVVEIRAKFAPTDCCHPFDGLLLHLLVILLSPLFGQLTFYVTSRTLASSSASKPRFPLMGPYHTKTPSPKSKPNLETKGTDCFDKFECPFQSAQEALTNVIVLPPFEFELPHIAQMFTTSYIDTCCILTSLFVESILCKRKHTRPKNFT